MSSPTHTVRFGPFEVDLRSAELKHNGSKIKIPEQCFQILAELVEHPGEVVTREELRQRLWQSETFVDFEHGLNTAVKRLRDALGDSAETPRYIETLPRHGYRLIVPVERTLPTATVISRASIRRRSVWLTVSALIGLAVAAALVSRLRLLERFWPVKIESLAVLPLENLSGNSDDEYFVDGMTEALITELGKLHALRVISRQSVMQYKGTSKTVQQIARELKVDAVVEGSALRAGGKVRITTQLIQANPERHLWSESYERDLKDVIALQGEMTQSIAREIRLSLTESDHQRLSQPRPVSPEAYEAFLKGNYFLSRNPQEIRKSVDFFQQAISMEPGYAPAYAGLAVAYLNLGDRNLLPADEAHEKARPLIKQALVLDDTLSEAHTALAGLLDTDWDWAGAEKEYRRAIELDPGNARARNWYGMFLLEMGRIQEALEENRRALQLNPTSRAINAALSAKLTVAGRYDEAVQQAKAALEMDEHSAPAHFALGLAYTKKGMREQAISELKTAVALTPGYSGYRGVLAYSYGVFIQTSEACRVAEEIRQLVTRNSAGQTDLAVAYAACGRNDEALQRLEQAYREHAYSLGYMKTDPTLEKLRPDPRFQDLLRRMNFPP